MADETENKTPEALPEPEKTEGPPGPTWEYRNNMKITERFTAIVNMTKDVAQAEINRLRKKVDKLTYGS
jgi:hypothetical protein